MDNNCLFRCQLTANSAATAKWYLNICKDKLRMNDAEQFVLQLLREFMYPVEFNVADDCRICKDCAQLLPAMLSQITAIRTKQTLVMEAFQDAGIINNDEVEVNAQSSNVDPSPSSVDIEQKLHLLMSEFARVSSNLVATIDLTEDEVIVKQEPMLDESLEEVVSPEKDRTPRPPLLSPDINSLPSLDSIFPPAVDLNLPSTPRSSTLPLVAFPPAPDNNLPPSIINNYLPLTTQEPAHNDSPSPTRNIAETEAANILLNLADHQQFSPQTPSTPFNNNHGRDSPDPNDHAPLDPNNIFNIIAKKLNLETKQNLIFGGNMKENTLMPDSKLRMFEGNVNDEDMEIIKNVNPDADIPTVDDNNEIDPEVEVNEDMMDTDQTDENMASKPGVLGANQDSNILDIKRGDEDEIVDCKAALMVHLPKPLFIENSTPSKGEFTCDTCEFKTKHRSSLKRHSHIHSGGKPKPHVCNVCDYQTANKGHLEVHMRLHTGHRPFKCPTCEFTAMQKSNLQRHMKTHSKEVKPHPCPTCMFRAGCKSDLIIHQRIHTGEKPYKCDECPYRGPSSSCLATHKRKHSNYRPFACKTCEYRTKFLSSLKIHERAHSGTKPFQCTKCNYKAIQQSKINRHMANVHKWE